MIFIDLFFSCEKRGLIDSANNINKIKSQRRHCFMFQYLAKRLISNNFNKNIYREKYGLESSEKIKINIFL